MTTYRGKYWVFTLNNPTDGEKLAVAALGQREFVQYLVVGREVAPTTGTPHLQGYIIFTSLHTLRRVKLLISQRVFAQRAAGTPTQAADYCKKEGDYDEYGTLPTQTGGRRSDWEHFREFVVNHQPGRILDREIFECFPGLYARYRESIHGFIDLIRGPISLVEDGAELRPGWQQDLYEYLETPANDREVRFYVDGAGDIGKSWFCRYMLTKKPDDVQVLCVGKRDDLANSIDGDKSIFLFDVPRGTMECLQYPVLEMLKNRMVYSPKYHGPMKKFRTPVHVIVFCNEEPDYNRMSADRFNVFHP